LGTDGVACSQRRLTYKAVILLGIKAVAASLHCACAGTHSQQQYGAAALHCQRRPSLATALHGLRDAAAGWTDE
jgi:hypothetical protein